MDGRYELFTTTEPDELWTRIDLAAQRFVSIGRDADPALPVSGATWSVRDVVGHVLTVVRRYTHGPTLGDTPRDVDRINDDELKALGDTPCDQLLDELVAELKRARDMFAPETVDLRMRVAFHGGVTVDMAAALSNLIGEFLVHGLDIAQTTHTAWPIDGRDAVLVLNGGMQILPGYANRSATRSLRLRLSVPGARPWLLDFDRGQLVSEPWTAGGRPADVVLRAPATTLLLTLYARLSPLAAASRGLVPIGGRRPWRIGLLPSLLEQP